MQIQEFALERIQSLYENTVEYNLSDSGVHPYRLSELLDGTQQKALLELELGYGWTNGNPGLRSTIAKLYEGRDADHVLVSNGSAEANFILAMSWLNPGDELIVIVPNYMQMAQFAEAQGVTLKQIPMVCDERWSLDMDAIRAAITPKTRMLSLCHPNNPTGATLSIPQMQELVQCMDEHQLYLHADEVYLGAEFDGQPLPSFGDLYDRAIVTSGLSKAMAMPGLRLGWLLAPKPVIEAAWSCKDYTSITATSVSEYVAEIVLQPAMRKRILQRSREHLLQNLDFISAWCERNGDWVSLVPPRAGGMAFVRYTLPVNSTELVHALRQHCGVFLLPGDVYGMDGHFRIGIGAPHELLVEGMQRVQAFVENNYLT